ncbi:MAG TPA: YCF48-related protein [Ignavibacteriaceae bacterium]|nr:YCF48-related protein [Ignavibacteriaceae bacterium]
MSNKLLFKSLFFLALFTFVTFAQEYTDWKWMHQQPQGNTLRWVKRFDANTWYAVGLAGTFMKTTDAGANWYFHHTAAAPFATSAQFANLYDAHFFNQTTGIVVGSSGTIYRTTDGGVSFATVTHPAAGTVTFYQVHFYDANNGFAVGTSGTLLKTTDAGLNWTAVVSGTTTSIYDIYAPDANNLYVVIGSSSAANFRKSTDGGATWTAVSLTAGGQAFIPYKVHFKDANTGFAVGAYYQVRTTTDGGATWNQSTTPFGLGSSTNILYDIDLVGPNVYVTGNSFYMIKSTNDGAAWDTLGFLADVGQQPWTSTYYATDFGASDADFVTAGAFGLVNTRYKTYSMFFRAGTLYDIWASNDGSKLIAAGGPSSTGFAFDQFVHSTNGGQNWSIATTTKGNAPKQTVFVPETEQVEESKLTPELTPSPYTQIWSIDMVTDQIGWAVGTMSAVYKTTDGGLTWDSVATTLPAGLTLRKVDFINQNVGWIFSTYASAAGTNTIFKTTDGGATWTGSMLTGQSASNLGIYGAHMLNENVGWVVSYKPRPYVTTDGGATWTEQNLVDTYSGFLYDIQMIDANVGYCVGGSGRIYKTTNGGVNWDTLTVPTRSYSNYNVHFLDANKGMVIGSSGTAFYTTDGGATWEFTNSSGATQYGLSVATNSKGNTTFYTAGSNAYMHKRTFVPPVVMIDWANLQWPATINVVRGDSDRVYAQAWINGVTPAPGAAPGLVCWIGVNSANTDPSTWNESAWKLATYNAGHVSNNDEFMADIGAGLIPGTYYYAARWQYNTAPYQYGGYSASGGGFWNGTTNNSGVLTVSPLTTTLWEKSAAQVSLPPWFSTTGSSERGLAFGKTNATETNDRVYVVSRNAGVFVKVVDALTGNDIGSLDITGISGGTHALSDVDVTSDGKILSCNLTTNASSDTFRVYMWNNEAALPIVALKYAGDPVRLGDKVTVTGDYTAGTAVIWAASATLAHLKVYKFTMSGGVFNPVPTIVTLADPTINAVGSASVGPLPNGDFYYKAGGISLKKFAADGTLLGTVPGTVVATGSNAPRYLGTTGGKELVVVYQYGAGNENARIIQVPVGDIPGASLYELTPSLGSNSNVGGTGDIAFRINNDGSATIFVLGTNNGFGAYNTIRPVPVELTSFTAAVMDKDVVLNWSTATESNSDRFQIERSNGNGWQTVGFVQASGTSTELKTYSFVDKNASAGKLNYRLKIVDFDGTYEYSQVINVEIGTPNSFSMSQNYPNPFNPTTRIDYQLPADANVTIELFDITGQKVGSLINQEMSAGYHSFDLEATNFKLATGMYIYRIVAIDKTTGNSFMDSKKMMFLK